MREMNVKYTPEEVNSILGSIHDPEKFMDLAAKYKISLKPWELERALRAWGYKFRTDHYAKDHTTDRSTRGR